MKKVMKQKALISMFAALTLLIAFPIVSHAADDPQPVFFDEPVLLTSDELSELAEIAPCHTETVPQNPLPRRVLTDSGFSLWQKEYLELGGINSFELEIIRLINEERAKHRLQPLGIMPHYMQAARFASQEMMDLNYFSHRSPVYGSRGAVIFRLGRNMGGAETIAGGTCPENIVKAWLDSPGHRNILLSQTAGAVGVGFSGFRATAIFISGNAQYIGFEVTVNQFLGR